MQGKCPESTIQFSKSGKSPYFQNSFLWLIDYISFNIDTTYTYYISNNWKLSQDFAEVLQYVLRCLREELWAAEQFSFFPPDLMHKCSKNSPITSLSQYALQSNMVTLLCTTVALFGRIRLACMWVYNLHRVSNKIRLKWFLRVYRLSFGRR